MIRISTLTSVAALGVILSGPATAQGTGAALTHRGSLGVSPDQQLGLVVPSPTQRRALFAAADSVLSILKRDDALARPIGYEVGLRRQAGVVEGGDDDHLLGNGVHFAVSGIIAYDVVEDDGHGGKTIAGDGDKVPFSIVVNAPGRLTDAERLMREPDRGPSVLGNIRQTGVYRGHPIYNGECVVISGRTVPPFVPVTMERYQKLLILNYRADSDFHTTQNRADLAKHQAAPKPKPPTGKLDANEQQVYDMVKKMDPAQAEAYRKQVLQADSEMYARTQDPAAARGDSIMTAMIRQAPGDAGAGLQQMQAKLDGMSPADRQKPVAVVIHHGDWEYNTDELIDINDPDGSPLVQLNSAFFDQARPVTAAQIITVCLPGIQGLENKDYDRYAGPEREEERAKLERRTRDAVLIRDRLDWAALEALVKP